MPTAPDVVRDLITTRVTLPSGILTEYELQATARGITLEALLSERLALALPYTASKPLYFSDDQRQQLEQLLGRNVLHTADALLQIRNAMSVRIERTVIKLKLNLLQKLKTRCIGMEWEKFLEQTTVHELERYVGLR